MHASPNSRDFPRDLDFSLRPLDAKDSFPVHGAKRCGPLSRGTNSVLGQIDDHVCISFVSASTARPRLLPSSVKTCLRKSLHFCAS
ncbi:hypothetical protein GQ602_005956 [Ophiocordyceps camponoti-floridani]|uniref:Uncharacterized protein n=1 Tax=Ophiocordyceps camponoti-floridani TaxID=2030778 RepID=A0A8H4Q2A0_9HYPO|nr:hypothetical protein GQ602_005956 [Ophiocordyceps camponoti-floridani]